MIFSKYGIRNATPSFVLALVLILGSSSALQANSGGAPDTPIGHCYHWLPQWSEFALQNVSKTDYSKRRLEQKLEYAKEHGGELLIQSNATGRNADAGAGLYCAKTPYGSTDYGDWLLRIDFVPSVVMLVGDSKVCGLDGHFYKTQAECDRQPVDVVYSNSQNHWYVIKNSKAILSWTANNSQLQADLQLALRELSPNTPIYNKIYNHSLAIQTTSGPFAPRTWINESHRLVLADERPQDSRPFLPLSYGNQD